MVALLSAAVIAQADLQADLSAILNAAALDRAAVGVYVKELGGTELFSAGGGKRLIPASALKLITASFAIANMGASKPLTTYAWREGTQVFLKGGADPLLTIDNLTSLGAQIGVERGDSVFFDDLLLGDERLNDAWELGDMMRADAPAVSGLTVNGGYADLVVKAGKPMLLPRNFGMAIKRGRVDGESSVRRSNGSWTVRVDGDLPADDDDFATVSLPDPALCAANILAGKATRKRLPAPPPRAKKFERAVAEVLPAMLKQSDNHAAETMLRLTGLNLGGDGSWDSALAKQAAWLRKIGIDSNEFRIADGSGLSRFTEITPRGLVQVLEWTLSHENGQLFEAAMCAPGQGTLRTRLAGIDLRAKTGTLTGVCSLVGFVDTRTKRRILFAIIFNHYDGMASSVRQIQDEFVKRLAVIESRPAPASLPR